MRKVVYVYTGKSIGGYGSLTVGKIYDVLNIITYKLNPGEIEMIDILNDYGEKCNYLIYDSINDETFFEDITHIYRNEIIDSILE